VLIPILYIKGISTDDFEEALVALLGKDAVGNAAEWLALSNVAVVGGWTPEVDLRAGAWDRITERARPASTLRK
jgi:2-keto-3-deoxy-6-phosphogluconate aldolase